MKSKVVAAIAEVTDRGGEFHVNQIVARINDMTPVKLAPYLRQLADKGIVKFAGRIGVWIRL